jgi:hypothetical protein
MLDLGRRVSPVASFLTPGTYFIRVVSRPFAAKFFLICVNLRQGVGRL